MLSSFSHLWLFWSFLSVNFSRWVWESKRFRCQSIHQLSGFCHILVGYIFQNFHQLKRVGASIEIFFRCFRSSETNSVGMKCPAHFQNTAADKNTESKTNIVAPVYSSTSLHDHWSFHFCYLPVFRWSTSRRVCNLSSIQCILADKKKWHFLGSEKLFRRSIAI